MGDRSGLRDDELERVADMQRGYEQRIARQGNRIGLLIAFLEARELVDDFKDFAAQREAGSVKDEPDADGSNKEG